LGEGRQADKIRVWARFGEVEKSYNATWEIIGDSKKYFRAKAICGGEGRQAYK